MAHVWGGLSFSQIAEILESSTSTVHRHYQAGLVALRELLGEACPTSRLKKRIARRIERRWKRRCTGLTPAAGHDRPGSADVFGWAGECRTTILKFPSFRLAADDCGAIDIIAGTGWRAVVFSGDEATDYDRSAGCAANTVMAVTSHPGNPFVPSVVILSNSPSGGFNYMQLRNAVLVHGVDALPPEPVSAAGSKSPRVVPQFPESAREFIRKLTEKRISHETNC